MGFIGRWVVGERVECRCAVDVNAAEESCQAS